MSREHVLWGTERIRGELLKLGLVVSNRSIRRYRWRGQPRPPSQSWRTFLRNHARAIWAADLFTVQTLTFRSLSVLFFISHGRRELLHFRVTARPTAAWVWQQLLNATSWGRSPRYLLRDRDRVYGTALGTTPKGLGVEQLLTPSVLRERTRWRTAWWAHRPARVPRPHARRERASPPRPARGVHGVLQPAALRRTLYLAPPVPTARALTGTIRSRPVLGGLHHRSDRVA